MLAKLTSAAIIGIEASKVEVEIDLTPSHVKSIIVGLPDAAVKESLERVTSAIVNSNFHYPHNNKLVVNLAPADVKKEGPAYDLPIAVGILKVTDQLKISNLEEFLIVGELALDGAVRPVKGCLPMAIAARDMGAKGVIVPRDNAPEVAFVESIEVYPVRDLAEVAAFLDGRHDIPPLTLDIDRVFESERDYEIDFAEVRGQEHAKRALTVATAGGHNVLMIGPPGSGKSMLAARIPTILPLLTLAESLETTQIHSVAGVLEPGRSLLAVRPFRAPHHTISNVALVGGGAVPKPGEISLAHYGVLFLDELPEFTRGTLEVLRQPIENGFVPIDRAAQSVVYPSRFMLVGAMNPCPCGFAGDPRRRCNCSPAMIQRYMSRISGPLMDRIDIHIEIPAIPFRELHSDRKGTGSAYAREATLAARAVQEKRFGGAAKTNSQMSEAEIKKFCPLDDTSTSLLRSAMEEFALSGRAYTRILKVARTIADIDGSEKIEVQHISEAVQYRALDRSL